MYVGRDLVDFHGVISAYLSGIQSEGQEVRPSFGMNFEHVDNGQINPLIRIVLLGDTSWSKGLESQLDEDIRIAGQKFGLYAELGHISDYL